MVAQVGSGMDCKLKQAALAGIKENLVINRQVQAVILESVIFKQADGHDQNKENSHQNQGDFG